MDRNSVRPCEIRGFEGFTEGQVYHWLVIEEERSWRLGNSRRAHACGMAIEGDRLELESLLIDRPVELLVPGD